MDKCCPPKGSCKGKAFMVLVLGVLFLLGTLGVWPAFTFGTYWPLFLILWGLHKLVCPCSCSKGMCGPKDENVVKGENMGGCCKK